MSRSSLARPAQGLVALAAGVAAVALLHGMHAPTTMDAREASPGKAGGGVGAGAGGDRTPGDGLHAESTWSPADGGGLRVGPRAHPAVARAVDRREAGNGPRAAGILRATNRSERGAERAATRPGTESVLRGDPERPVVSSTEAANCGNDSAILLHGEASLLSGSLPDPTEHVRVLSEALRSARGRGDRMLARHLEDRLAVELAADDGVRAAFLRALVEERDPGISEALLDLLERSQLAIAATIHAAIADPDADADANADAPGTLGEAMSGPDAQATADAGEQELRFETRAAANARAIAEVNDALTDLLESGAPSRARVRALSLYRWSLEGTGDEAWIEAVSRVAMADHDSEAQGRAIRVLAARVPGAAVTERIAELSAGHADPAVRGAAAAALAHRVLPRGRPQATLAALSDDPEPQVRRAACEALESALLRPAREDSGRIPPDVAHDVVLAIAARLEDEADPGVRRALLRTLLVAGGDAALPWLEAHAEGGELDPELHRALGAALDLPLAATSETLARRAALAERAPELFAGGR